MELAHAQAQVVAAAVGGAGAFPPGRGRGWTNVARSLLGPSVSSPARGPPRMGHSVLERSHMGCSHVVTRLHHAHNAEAQTSPVYPMSICRSYTAPVMASQSKIISESPHRTRGAQRISMSCSVRVRSVCARDTRSSPATLVVGDTAEQ